MSRAAYWYKEAAEQGVIEAQFNLGTMYAAGSGVPKGFRRAVKWLSAVSNNGLSPGQYNLGALYEHGVGIRIDEQTAVLWYQLAAGRPRSLDETPEGATASALETTSEIAESPSSSQQAANDWAHSLPASRHTLQLISHTAEQRAPVFIRGGVSVKPRATTRQDAMGEPTFP